MTPFDVFDRGLYRYTFTGVCQECPDLKIGDRAWRVFINTEGTNPDKFTQEFLDFMDYITDSTDTCIQSIKSKKIRAIHERVKEVKQSEKTGVKLMQRWEEIFYERQDARAEGKREGRREGKAEGRTDSILELLGELGVVPEDLAVQVREQKEERVLSRWLKLAAKAAGIEEFRDAINVSET